MKRGHVQMHSQIKLISTFSISLFVGNSFAQDLKPTDQAPIAVDVCAGPDIKSMSRPYYPESEKSPTFTYRYKYLRTTSKRLNPPTLILIPGGPGETMIEDSVSMPPEDIKYGNVVLIDPRGIGCNKPKGSTTFPDKFYSSRFHALDILAIVQNLKIKDGNFIIHGGSYGTLVATMVGSLSETVLYQTPRAVVLDSVIGRAYSERERAEDTLDAIKSFVDRLPPKIRHIFETEEAPLGIAGEKWLINFYFSGMYAGLAPDGTDGAMTLITPLFDPSTDTETRELLTSLVKGGVGEDSLASGVSGKDPNLTKFYNQIQCLEVQFRTNNDVPADFRGLDRFKAFASALADQNDNNPCKNVKGKNSLFNAKDYQIKAPIYMLSGGLDFATPTWQARYAFEAQVSSKQKTLLTMKDAGHIGLSFLSQANCTEKFWKAVIDSKDLKIALKGCQGTYEVRH